MTGFMLHGLGDCTEAHHCGCLATQSSAVDHTQAIAEAAREYVRGVGAWESSTRLYPNAAEDALFAAVEAERLDAGKKKEGQP